MGTDIPAGHIRYTYKNCDGQALIKESLLFGGIICVTKNLFSSQSGESGFFDTYLRIYEKAACR